MRICGSRYRLRWLAAPKKGLLRGFGGLQQGAQGTLGVVQACLGVVQASLGVVQGTFGVVQAVLERCKLFWRGASCFGVVQAVLARCKLLDAVQALEIGPVTDFWG